MYRWRISCERGLFQVFSFFKWASRRKGSIIISNTEFFPYQSSGLNFNLWSFELVEPIKVRREIFDFSEFHLTSVRKVFDLLHGLDIEHITLATAVEIMVFCYFYGKINRKTESEFETNLFQTLSDLIGSFCLTSDQLNPELSCWQVYSFGKRARLDLLPCVTDDDARWPWRCVGKSYWPYPREHPISNVWPR